MQFIPPAEGTFSSKGQLVVPPYLREALGVHRGAKVRMEMTPRGMLVSPVQSVTIKDIRGMLHRPGMKPMAQEDMNQAIMDVVAADDERIKRDYAKAHKKHPKPKKPR